MLAFGIHRTKMNRVPEAHQRLTGPRSTVGIQTKKVKPMIRKLKTGEYRLYSRKKDVKSGRRRNLGTFKSLEKAKAHEKAVQYFKRH